MNLERASSGKVCKKWNLLWQCAAWNMITIWLSPNHHNVKNKHMWVCLVACFSGKHALYYSCWTFVWRNNAKRHISDSVFCVMFLLCYQGYEYICQAAVFTFLLFCCLQRCTCLLLQLQFCGYSCNINTQQSSVFEENADMTLIQKNQTLYNLVGYWLCLRSTVKFIYLYMTLHT